MHRKFIQIFVQLSTPCRPRFLSENAYNPYTEEKLCPRNKDERANDMRLNRYNNTGNNYHTTTEQEVAR